jgi:hypothetical protein
VSLSYVVPDGENDQYVIAQERLCKTEDGRLVPEGHPDARWFHAVKGARLPLAEAVAGGLVKARTPAANKGRKPEGDK